MSLADFTTNMKVTGISQYVTAMNQAKTSVKTLDAELKKNEAAYKASGDKEAYMTEKSRLLEQKMKAQENAVKKAEDALKAMTKQGVDPASTSYQKMTQQLLQAQTGMLQTTSELNNLTQGEQQAAAGADQLTASVNGINKKVSLDAVKSGIDSMTQGLENAARKAVEVGQTIWNEIMNRAQWADDTATQAMMLNMGVEEYQRYKHVFDTFGELTVADWQKAKLKVQKAIYNPTTDQIDVFAALGISPTEGGGAGKFGDAAGIAKDWETVFWQAGQKLREMVANKQISQDQADVYANALFGKGFANLNPMFAMGAEKFYRTVNEQSAVTEDAVNNLSEMNDEIAKLKGKYQDLETEVLAGLAPSLTEASKAMSGLLDKLLVYVQSEDGQKMLEDLGTAISGLFEDLGKIDPDEVVKGFTGVFNTVVGGFQWLVDNIETVKGFLVTIVTAWGAAKLAGGALEVLQLINGLTSLGGASAITAATTGGTLAGKSWASAFGVAVKAILPGLVATYLSHEFIRNLPSDYGQQISDALGLTVSEAEEEVDKINHENGLDTIGDLEDQIQKETDQGRNPAKRVFDYIFGVGDESQYAEPQEPKEQKTHPGGRVRHITGIVGELPTATDEFVDLDEAETMLQLTEDQIAAAQEYWDIMRSGTTSAEQEMLGYQDMLDHFIGDDASMQQLEKLLSLIDSLPKNTDDLPEWWWSSGDEQPVVEPEVDIKEAQAQLNAADLKVPVWPVVPDDSHIWGFPEIPRQQNAVQPEEIVEEIDLDEAETMVRLTEAQAAAAQKYWDIMRDGTKSVDQQTMAYQDLLDHFIGDDASMEQMTALMSLIESLPKEFEDLPEMWWNGGEDIIVEPEIDTEEAQKQLDANPLTVPVIPKMWEAGGWKWPAMPKANGLPFVPFDGYPAILHKGERVLTARENASRSFSSNLYVESMYMNNGADADGLAARIAAQNRRIMAGHGS